MSDTPKTDNACGWPWGHHGRIECSDLKWSPDGPFVHSELARHLERENVALRKQLEQWEQSTQWFSEWAEKKQELERAEHELEEENRGLHVELDAYYNGEQLRHLRAEVAGLRGALEESQEYGRNHANAVMKLLSIISRIRRAVDEQPNKSQAMRLEDVGDLCDEALGKKSSP